MSEERMIFICAAVCMLLGVFAYVKIRLGE